MPASAGVCQARQRLTAAVYPGNEHSLNFVEYKNVKTIKLLNESTRYAVIKAICQTYCTRSATTAAAANAILRLALGASRGACGFLLRLAAAAAAFLYGIRMIMLMSLVWSIRQLMLVAETVRIVSQFATLTVRFHTRIHDDENVFVAE